MTFPVKPRKGQPVRAELVGQIIDCLRMFRPLPGHRTSTKCTPGGTIVNVTDTPGGTAAYSGLEPWTIRHHVTEDDDDGQWEIYLPTGCMSVGAPLQNLNKAASETSGHDGDGEDVRPDPPDWRILPVDEDEGSAQTRTDGDVTKTFREFEVVAHAKTSARLDGVDAINKPAKRYLWVSVRKVLGPNEQQPSDEDQAKDTWGDEFAQTVARIEVGTRQRQGKEAQAYRKVTQLARAPISVAGRPRTGFDLEWMFDFDDNGALEVSKVYCVRQVASAAGITLSGPEMTDVTDAQQTIYAKILTNPLNPENSSTVEVVKDATGFIARDNYVTWLRLYGMAYNAVINDFRAQSLANIQVYR